jgi:hypothetical protein
MRDTKTSYFKFIGIVLLLSLPLLGLIGMIISRNIITPNDQFFVITKGEIPQLSSSNWTLSIDGHVNNNLTFSYSNFTSQPSKEVLATIQCVEGPFGTAVWKGVSLKSLLNTAQLKPGAIDVIFYAADNYSSSLTIDEATADDVLLAYNMNGVPLPAEQGYPLRVVAPNHWGYKWVKWVVRVEVVNYDYIGFWESRGWADNARKTPFSDWILHAILFSITFLLGGLAVFSGLKPSPITETFRGLPKFVNKKFHITCSIAYFLASIGSFIYWIITTFINRGAIFYTFHGILALSSIIFAVPAVIAGIKKTKKRDSRNRTWHYRWTVISFSLFLITIMFGFLLAFTGQFQLF